MGEKTISDFYEINHKSEMRNRYKKLQYIIEEFGYLTPENTRFMAGKNWNNLNEVSKIICYFFAKLFLSLNFEKIPNKSLPAEICNELILNENTTRGTIRRLKESRKIRSKSLKLKNKSDSEYYIDIDGVEFNNAYKALEKFLIFSPEEVNVIHVKEGKPLEARGQLEEFIKDINGEVKIVDTYFSKDTISVLDSLIKSASKIKFLVGKKASFNISLINWLDTYQKEVIYFHIKKSQTDDLHDRYILTENKLVLFGHSIKDFGIKKESFITIFDSKMLGDTITTINNKFDERWEIANYVNQK